MGRQYLPHRYICQQKNLHDRYSRPQICRRPLTSEQLQRLASAIAGLSAEDIEEVAEFAQAIKLGGGFSAFQRK